MRQAFIGRAETFIRRRSSAKIDVALRTDSGFPFRAN